MISIRTCLGCGQRGPKEAMLRIVCQRGRLRFDHGGTLPGRAGYFCGDEDCARRLSQGKVKAKPPGGCRDAALWRELITDMQKSN